jgi:hypothetical protein
MTSHLLANDQGTTSSGATVFRADCTVAAIAQQEIPQHFPQSGWVEHDPEDLWRTVVATGREAIAMAGLACAGFRRDRHHQPARDHAGVGSQRQADLQRCTGSPTFLARRSTGRPSWSHRAWRGLSGRAAIEPLSGSTGVRGALGARPPLHRCHG